MTHDQTHTALGYLAGRQLPPLSVAALRMVVLIAKWEERRQTRKALKHLDAHLLDDVGLSRADARRELNRRFWQQ
jgi:uncharacterized protein YjiS (DUF1127 family)